MNALVGMQLRCSASASASFFSGSFLRSHGRRIENAKSNATATATTATLLRSFGHGRLFRASSYRNCFDFDSYSNFATTTAAAAANFCSSASEERRNHNNHSHPSPERLGARLRDWLGDAADASPLQHQHQHQLHNNSGSSETNDSNNDNDNDNDSDDLLSVWKHAEDVFRCSLQELRVLRAREERDGYGRSKTNHNSNSNFNFNSHNHNHNGAKRDTMIRDCLRLLDRLSDSLPREEDYSSSYWFSADDDDSSLVSATSVLDRDLLNELLKEWGMAWKAAQQRQRRSNSNSNSNSQRESQRESQHNNRKILPGPSQMAEKIDRYRSRCLVQPDPTSFNLLLNAMIGDENHSNNNRGNNNGNHRTKAVRLADDYLRRLLEAQQRSPASWNDNRNINAKYVDIVSVTTVMKGWVDLGQPQKAQEWLDTILTMSGENSNADIHPISLQIRPNAVAYATLVHGWAKRGEALQAEAVLYRALEEAARHIADRSDGDVDVDVDENFDGEFEGHDNFNGDGNLDDKGIITSVPIVDRVVFHTVLDAWAARASRNNNDDDDVIPAVRSKALVQTMDDLADRHPLRLGHLRPNDETWHKLIAVVACTASKAKAKSKAHARKLREEVGPQAAEKLLVEFETKHDNRSSSDYSPTPAILLNRILHAYCASGTTMEDAEAFFHRRCNLLPDRDLELHVDGREMTSDANTIDSASANAYLFPNEVTFHTILDGWANAARVASKKKKKPKQSSTYAYAAAIPFRAEAWLEAMREHRNESANVGLALGTRSYGSVLQAWSLSTVHHGDAADRAEDLLRRSVWPLLDGSDQELVGLQREAEDLRRGIVIGTNIVLRAWSNQAAAAVGTTKTNNTTRDGRAVGKCLRLLHDFLALIDEANTDSGNNLQHKFQLKPTEETFRAVLHAIATPSNGMTAVQKHDHAKALLHQMQDRYRLRPSKGDLSKFERLKKTRDGYLERRRRKR